MISQKIATSLLICLLGTTASSQDLGLMRADSFLRNMNSSNVGDQNAASAYFLGMSEAITMFIGYNQDFLGTGLVFCPPNGVILNGGMIRTAFLQGHRTYSTEYAVFDIFNGLRSMYPCN